MLTSAWTKLNFHAQQDRLWRTKARFCAVAAGRGSGKTEVARRRTIRMLPVIKPWANPLYFYALPTLNQARRVAWEPLLALIPSEWIKEINKSEMKITTVFGSTLYVLGMDKPARAEGVQWDGGVLDESCDQRPGVFDRTLLPALSHRRGWCWRIGVPKRYGIGAQDFKAFFQKGLDGVDGIESYTWSSEEILPTELIKFAMENLDIRDYREQYQASWESVSGCIFYAFSEEHNVDPEIAYDPDMPIIVGSDFNVDPMAWVLAQIQGDEINVFDELFLRNTNTAETLTYLANKFPKHDSGWEFYGDASSRARKTSAAMSDYLQIRGDKRFKGARIFYPKTNPAIVDRFAACNAVLCNALNRRRLRVHPRCTNLINDLKYRAWKSGVREPDDYGDLGHITDGLGYIIHRRFPLMVQSNKSSAQVSA